MHKRHSSLVHRWQTSLVHRWQASLVHRCQPILVHMWQASLVHMWHTSLVKALYSSRPGFRPSGVRLIHFFFTNFINIRYQTYTFILQFFRTQFTETQACSCRRPWSGALVAGESCAHMAEESCAQTANKVSSAGSQTQSCTTCITARLRGAQL